MAKYKMLNGVKEYNLLREEEAARDAEEQAWKMMHLIEE